MNLDAARTWLTLALQSTSTSPALDADGLICLVAEVARTRLYSHPEELLGDDAVRRLRELLKKRQSGVPMAYITGTKEFWSLPFMVTGDVLIPRADTELLVALCLERLPVDAPARVLELGTGSGAIAISVAIERPQATFIATDISPAAIEVARRNATFHQVSHIDFVQSDWFSCLENKHFDLIVSNPPYVAHDDPALEEAVFHHEPSLAVIAQDNGMAALQTIVSDAPGFLAPQGHLLVEHGWHQAQQVQRLFIDCGFRDTGSHQDLAGRLRVTAGTRS